MHEFKYKGREFTCEGISVARAAKKFGTPLYLYSRRTILEHYRKLAEALEPVKPLICFSMKANANLAICRSLVKKGAGLDVVSGGELYKALKIGANPKKIVYAGVGKTEKEIEAGVRAGILFFNVESFPELKMIDQVCKKLGKTANVALRVNPDIDPQTHRFITTGKAENKFGIDLATARDIFLRRFIFPNLRMVGVHVHIGSQITKKEPFVKALKKVSRLIKELKAHKVGIRYLNIGGGLGIVYRNERPQTAREFAKAVLPILKKTGLKIILEPGRFIIGNASVLITRVSYVKKTPAKNFIIVDAGMNDLMRPCLYDAYHEILPALRKPGKSLIKADIVGPVCETSDVFGKNRKIQEPAQGDLLVMMSAGAYGFSMASNYNGRPLACETMADGNKLFMIRRRQSYQDLVKNDIIPAALK
jgi:diaminopimelate decarboxylase